jgi:hypothetical protein
MSMMNRPSLSTTYFDPEAIEVPEPEPIPDPPKRRGRPPGSKSKPKEAKPVKRNIPWFTISRSVFWAGVTAVSLTCLYRGVEGWLGQNAAYITLAVTVIIAAVLLDRGWQKIRGNSA